MTAHPDRTWIDDTLDLPLYQQVRRLIEARLADGAYPPRRSVPSSRALASELGVSRNTVLVALDELVAAGLLVSQPRSGLWPGPTAGTLRDRAPEAVAAPPAVTGQVDWSDLILRPVEPTLRPVIEPDFADFPYPFLPGQLEPRTFPSRAWLRALTSAFDGPHLSYSVRDSVDVDDPLLVEAICRHILPARGITASPDEVLITAGAQQALSLISDALLQPGRAVAMENPGYPDAADIFTASGASLQLLDVDDQGAVIPADLDVDVCYVTPSHQHPTNATLSATRRSQLLRIASSRHVVVIEDDFDSEVRFRGRPTRPLRSFDDSGRVIYLGTFSKFLAPGIRLGYVVGAPELIRELRHRRFLQTKHPAGVLQRALAIFIMAGDFHRVMREHRARLGHKWTLVDGALRDHLPFPVPPGPAGGLSMWVTAPTGFDATDLTRRLRERGVLISPGEAYHLEAPRPRNSFRLGFNAISPERIERGIEIIGRTITELA